MRTGAVAAVLCSALFLGGAAASADASSSQAASASQASLRAREAAFLRGVDPHNTANVVTGDLVHFAGTHVAYACEVDRIVRAGLILGQCGSVQEPMDLFVHLPTGRLHLGERLRVLGVMEQPAMWTDVTGHTVYYAFLRAVFVDPL
jgi:hypothetical protein